MEISADTATMLQQLPQPAFLVKDGKVIATNSGAADRFIHQGDPIRELLTTGLEEYSAFQGGILYVSLCVCGAQYPCMITALEDGHLFAIQCGYESASLQTLSLASQQLNLPFAELSLLISSLEESDFSQKPQLMHRLFQLKRILGNMADAADLAYGAQKLQNCQICSVLSEVLEKATGLLSENGIQVTYRIPSAPIYTMANPEIIRRAMYNLLSNAAKFLTDDNRIHADVSQKGNMLHITLSGGDGAAAAGKNLFCRYSRQPSLEDVKFGLGLGMSLVHSAATAHSGAIFIRQDDPFQITMTIAITHRSGDEIRSPVMIPDRYGGYDQALVELSDVLSPQQYQDR